MPPAEYDLFVQPLLPPHATKTAIACFGCFTVERPLLPIPCLQLLKTAAAVLIH